MTGKTESMEKFQITDLPKFGSPVFQVSTETEYQYQPLYEKFKKWPILLISIVQKNSKLLTPPPHTKVWVTGFLSVEEMEYQCQPLWKKRKMAAISLILIVQKNSKLQTPSKFGSPVFQVSTEMKFFHWFSFPHHPMLCLKHLWEDIYEWTYMHGDLSVLLSPVYPRSHLCVVLHLLSIRMYRKAAFYYTFLV